MKQNHLTKIKESLIEQKCHHGFFDYQQAFQSLYEDDLLRPLMQPNPKNHNENLITWCMQITYDEYDAYERGVVDKPCTWKSPLLKSINKES